MTDPSVEIPKENECLMCDAPCVNLFCSERCFNDYNND